LKKKVFFNEMAKRYRGEIEIWFIQIVDCKEVRAKAINSKRNTIENMRKDKLAGEVDGKKYQVLSDAGQVAQLSEAVAPILVQEMDSLRLQFVGTGFFIGHEGLMITAKHVLDVVRSRGKVVGPIGVCHMTAGNKFHLRNIMRSFEYPNSDVAVVLLDQPRHKFTGETLKNRVVTLSFDECRKSDPICTFAYPKSVVESDGRKHLMEFSPAIFEGRLIEEFPTGRDKSILPNPCWQTSMHIYSGASGGPVFNLEGRVIGVNSTSLTNDTS